MMNVVPRTGTDQTPAQLPDADPLMLFAQGTISRQLAAHRMGDIGYGELLNRLAERGLPLPVSPPDELARMAQDVVRLLNPAE